MPRGPQAGVLSPAFWAASGRPREVGSGPSRGLLGGSSRPPSPQDMKALCVSLCLLGAGLVLCSAHPRGLRRCLISTNLHRVEESFRGIKTAIVSAGLG